MRVQKITYLIIALSFWSLKSSGQQFANLTYETAYELAYDGDTRTAQKNLEELLSQNSGHEEASGLLARTYSWNGQYQKARSGFNKLLSQQKHDGALWSAAIKNEIYAGAYHTALGLANKALVYVQNSELERLQILAKNEVEGIQYGKEGWFNVDEKQVNSKKGTKKEKRPTETKEEPKNRIGINNVATVFSDRFDPQFFSSISYQRKTPIGSIIPRINYSSRVGRQGVQYDIDLYPKFAKGFYAYLNYGYSDAVIYPKHKMGGDIYMALPGSFEFSAGARHIVTRTRNVTGISNSLGLYRGNYYFSLRSLVTPKSDGLTRVSGNLLVRKYLRNSLNFMGFTGGIGISPELRQFITNDQVLAETIFFIETQRLNLEYQFTNKQNTNIYRARLGVRRQEISFESGNFFWGFTAGLIYSVNF